MSVAPIAPPPLELLAMRAPRYTSYPTALQFDERIGPDDAVRALRQSNDDWLPAPLSLYLHVPFCHSNCFYCGCHRKVTRNVERMAAYANDLARELGQRAALLDADRQTVQVHFGGGTPNHLPSADLCRVMETLHHHYAPDEQADISLEIDPRLVEGEEPALWASLGFNRISIGVQDVDDRVQRLINRVQPAEQVARCVEQCRHAGFESINFDLIYGLPAQSMQSIDATLDFVEQQRPERVAAFGYAHLPDRLRAQRAINRVWLPDATARLALRNRIEQRLLAAGYVSIGLDHYALPSDSLASAHREQSLHRNFQGYTTHAGCDVIGFGVSSISRIGDTFAQHSKSIDDYHTAIDQGLWPVVRGYRQCDDDRLREQIIMALMCDRPVDLLALGRQYGMDPNARFGPALEAIQSMAPRTQPLVVCESGVLRATPEGRPFLRLIAAQFDAFANAQRGHTNVAV